MNLINKKNMEENMNDMHGEETPRTDLTLFSEKMQEHLEIGRASCRERV